MFNVSGPTPSRPTQYQKKPLNHAMDKLSRRRRVLEKREVLKDWAEAEGVTVTELLGFLLHLENYQQGDRGVASIGWQLFTGEKVFEK